MTPSAICHHFVPSAIFIEKNPHLFSCEVTTQSVSLSFYSMPLCVQNLLIFLLINVVLMQLFLKMTCYEVVYISLKRNRKFIMRNYNHLHLYLHPFRFSCVKDGGSVSRCIHHFSCLAVSFYAMTFSWSVEKLSGCFVSSVQSLQRPSFKLQITNISNNN